MFLPEDIISRQAPLIEWGLTPPWKFKYKTVTRIPVEQRKEMREGFTSNIRNAFIETATAMFKDRRGHLSESLLAQVWVTHHILPLCFGGTNRPSNLALIPYSAHCALHQFIDRQIFRMAEGETRTIWIPYQDGSIWQKGLTFETQEELSRPPVRQRTHPEEIEPRIFQQANKLAQDFAFS